VSAALTLDGVPSLVDLLLAEQRTLRAVDEFSAWHDAGEGHGGRFESLIPSALPGAGQQFAFAVDLDSCTGCKACVTACHSLNGLEVGETWRKVGELESGGAGCDTAHRQTVTTACHHCAEPACLEGCPVRAYEKDPITGIVIHLDDQCIGCRYCQLMCPYDVPQFSERLGIVRKCDMCHARLSAGEAPACVQGCPNEAISIEIVDVDFDLLHVASNADPGRDTRAPSHGPSSEAMLLPVIQGGMPRSALTGPTTRYRTARAPAAGLRAVEGLSPMPSEPHTPLAAMLVLTQASIGTLLFDLLLAAIFPASYGHEALRRCWALRDWASACSTSGARSGPSAPSSDCGPRG
jgi:formate dehydrogenase iron-sulfur subunit